MAADTLDLFPDLDLGSRPAGDGCARPIGKRNAGRGRRGGSVPRRSPLAAQLHELRLLVERHHAEIMAELHALWQRQRDAARVLSVWQPAGRFRRHQRQALKDQRGMPQLAADNGEKLLMLKAVAPLPPRSPPPPLRPRKSLSPTPMQYSTRKSRPGRWCQLLAKAAAWFAPETAVIPSGSSNS